MLNKNNWLSKYDSIEIVESTNKLGDWIFKLPLINSIHHKFGKKIYFKGNEDFLLLPFMKRGSSSKKSLKILLTRKDLPSPKINGDIIEIYRNSKNKEVVFIKFKDFNRERKFSSLFEEERVEEITNFLGFVYLPQKVPKLNLSKKNAILNFNVGENNEERLDINLEEIKKSLEFLDLNRFKIKLICQKNSKNKINEFILKNCPFVKCKFTYSLKEAIKTINQYQLYFGVDCGLSHYMALKGKLVFSLFSKKFHGQTPLFRSSLSNDLSFFGDSLFYGELIKYLEILISKNKQLNYLFSRKERFSDNYYIFGEFYDKFDNESKLLRLIFQINKQFIEYFDNAGIFLPDRVYEIKYSEIAPKIKSLIWLDQKKIIDELQEFLDGLDANLRESISLWAKPCSFFYKTALHRKSSDIDNMRILFQDRNISNKRKEKVIRGLCSVLNRNNLAIKEPHQRPLEVKSKPNGNVIEIISRGIVNKNIPEIRPSDNKNFERYESRLKLKVIMGNLSPNFNQIGLKDFLVKELKVIFKNKSALMPSLDFFYKMEAILEKFAPFGTAPEINIYTNRKESTKVLNQIELLMNLGIVYYNYPKLYLLWDTRRPQHGWFVPLNFYLEGINLSNIKKRLATCFGNNIFSRGPYKYLKKLHKNPHISTLFKSLKSNSNLVTMEAYNFLRNFIQKNNEIIKEVYKMARKQVNKEEDNCDSSKNKIIHLCRLLVFQNQDKFDKERKFLNFSPLTNHSRYNLFTDIVFSNNGFPSNIFEKITTSKKTISNEFLIDTICKIYNLSLFKENLENMIPKKLIRSIDEKILYLIFARIGGLLNGPKKQKNDCQIFLSEVNFQNLKAKDILEFTKKHNINLKFPQNLNLESLALKEINKSYITRQLKRNLLKKANELKNFFHTNKDILNKLQDTFGLISKIDYRRKESYQELLRGSQKSNVIFKGSSTFVFSKNKFVTYLGELDGIIFCFMRKKVMDIIGAKILFSAGEWGVVIPQDLIRLYTRFSSIFPEPNFTSYKELYLGQKIILFDKEYVVEEISGEGNFSVVYGVSRNGTKICVKVGLMDFLSENVLGTKLFKVSNLFSNYLGYDKNLCANIIEYAKGNVLRESKINLETKVLKNIFSKLVKCYKEGFGHGDLNINNIILNDKDPIKIIDPAWFYESEKALAQDIVGILRIIYFNSYKRRFRGYWEVRTKVIESNKPLDVAFLGIYSLDFDKKILNQFRDIIGNKEDILKLRWV